MVRSVGDLPESIANLITAPRCAGHAWRSRSVLRYTHLVHRGLGDVRRADVIREHLIGLRPESPELSRRELVVARQVAAGLTNRAITEQLFISERTVESHLSHIFTKLSISSRTQLIVWLTSCAAEQDPSVRV